MKRKRRLSFESWPTVQDKNSSARGNGERSTRNLTERPPLSERIRQGLEDAILCARGELEVRTTVVEVAPRPMSPREIIRLSTTPQRKGSELTGGVGSRDYCSQGFSTLVLDPESLVSPCVAANLP